MSQYTLVKADFVEWIKEARLKVLAGEMERFHAVFADGPYYLGSIVDRFGGEDSAPAKPGTDGVFQRTSSGFMNQCYHPETEVLTEDGWKNIKELVDTNYQGKAYTLNLETEEIELSSVIDRQAYPFNGNLIHFKSRSIDLLVTPNHNLVVRNNDKLQFRLASDSGNIIRMACQGIWNVSSENEEYEIEGVKYPLKHLMRFLGIYLGDGCVVHRKKQPEKQDFIAISAFMPRKAEHIKQVCESLGVKHTQYQRQTIIYNKAFNRWLSPMGHAHEKYIPEWVFSLPVRYLKELWQGLLTTDGHTGKDGTVVQFFTSSPQMADDVQRLLLHIGLSGTSKKHEPKPDRIIAGRKVKTGMAGYVISVHKSNKTLWYEQVDHKTGKQNTKLIPYAGMVYDLTVAENHTLFVRRNGRAVWSSNSWDGFDSPYHFQTWTTEWAKPMLDVVYPGTLGLFYGSPRTSHRLACGLEDAGWIIYDTIMFIHGCVDQETEYLTPNGWKRYHEETGTDRIMCYNKDTDSFQWEVPSHVTAYKHQDTAYRIQSDHTDQLVSPNHRCLVEREGKMVFEFAETLAQEHEIRVPVLEDVRPLLQSISDTEQHAGATKHTLRELRPQFWDSKEETRSSATQRKNDHLQRVRYRVLPFSVTNQGNRELLQLSLHGSFTRTRTDKTFAQRECGEKAGIHSQTSNQNGWRTKSSMEGRSNLSQSKGKLCQSIDKVRSLPGQVHYYGASRWLRYGTQTPGSTSHWETVNSQGSRSSRESRRDRQSDRELDVVCIERGSQKLRRKGNTSTDLATITPVYYHGLMWCPTVSTGAFVARRNGMVFVTGNSGFPKSHNVSKNIDKQKGAKRKVVGHSKNGAGASRIKIENHDHGDTGVGHWDGTHQEYDITEPATLEAEQWEGYGSALKPAYEPIIVARAPRQNHTFVELAQKFGTGSLNINGTRIPGTWEWGTQTDIRGGKFDQNRPSEGHVFARNIKSNPGGRWPANLAFDRSAAESLDEVVGDRPSTGNHPSDARPEGTILGGRRSQGALYDDKGGPSRYFFTADESEWEETAGSKNPTREGEASANRRYTDEGVTNFAPLPGMRGGDKRGRWPANLAFDEESAAELDEVVGERKAGGSVTGNEPSHTGETGIYGEFDRTSWNSYEDTGGPSRFFYVAKPATWEREAGLYDEPEGVGGGMSGTADQSLLTGSGNIRNNKRHNTHPTLKSIQLNTWLAKLVLPPAHIGERRILIPFVGSGSEAIGAHMAGWDTIIGIERDEKYCEINQVRTKWWMGFDSYEDAKKAAKVETEQIKRKSVKPVELTDLPFFKMTGEQE